MNLYDAVRKRRSIRKYKPGKTVSDEDIHKILEAGMMAPSACNTRPWEFFVFKSEEARESYENSCECVSFERCICSYFGERIARDTTG